jgi:hypothetical protein
MELSLMNNISEFFYRAPTGLGLECRLVKLGAARFENITPLKGAKSVIHLAFLTMKAHR